MAELGAAADLERHPERRQVSPQLAHAVDDLPGVDRPQIEAKMRGGHNGVGALRHGAPGELQAFDEVSGPIVDSGEEMEVEIG